MEIRRRRLQALRAALAVSLGPFGWLEVAANDERVLYSPGGPVVILDNTPHAAALDGTIQASEYIGSSGGINSGFGNVIGEGSELFIDSSRTDPREPSPPSVVTFGLRSGGGNLLHAMVLYLDTAPGGISSTENLTDAADPLRRAISGFDGANRSMIEFAPGFEPDYAIAVASDFAGVWQLVENGSHTFQQNAELTPLNDQAAGEWEFETELFSLALSEGDTLRYIATYLNSGNVFRSDEFHGVYGAHVPPGNPGHATVTLGPGDFNTFVTVPVATDVATWNDLLQLEARPNPFRTSTDVAFMLPERAVPSIEVFDVAGRLVRKMTFSGSLAPGSHFVTWDGRDHRGRRLSEGVYFLRVRADAFQATRRLTLLR